MLDYSLVKKLNDRSWTYRRQDSVCGGVAWRNRWSLMHKSSARHVSAAKQSITQDMVPLMLSAKKWREHSVFFIYLYHQHQSTSTLLQQNKRQTIMMHLKMNNLKKKKMYMLQYMLLKIYLCNNAKCNAWFGYATSVLCIQNPFGKKQREKRRITLPFNSLKTWQVTINDYFDAQGSPLSWKMKFKQLLLMASRLWDIVYWIRHGEHTYETLNQSGSFERAL